MTAAGTTDVINPIDGSEGVGGSWRWWSGVDGQIPAMMPSSATLVARRWAYTALAVRLLSRCPNRFKLRHRVERASALLGPRMTSLLRLGLSRSTSLVVDAPVSGPT